MREGLIVLGWSLLSTFDLQSPFRAVLMEDNFVVPGWSSSGDFIVYHDPFRRLYGRYFRIDWSIGILVAVI